MLPKVIIFYELVCIINWFGIRKIYSSPIFKQTYFFHTRARGITDSKYIITLVGWIVLLQLTVFFVFYSKQMISQQQYEIKRNFCSCLFPSLHLYPSSLTKSYWNEENTCKQILHNILLNEDELGVAKQSVFMNDRV